MASQNRQPRPDPVASTALQAKAERTVAKMQWYYRIGQEANVAAGRATAAKSRATTARWAKKYRINHHSMGLARAFARQYDEGELADLCSLRKKNGLPFHSGFLPFLLTIPCKTAKEKAARSRVQREAAKKGRSDYETYCQIRRKRGQEPKSSGGRRLAWLGLREFIRNTTNWVGRCGCRPRRS